jgi:uncharacterized protein (DUF2141 family)
MRATLLVTTVMVLMAAAGCSSSSSGAADAAGSGANVAGTLTLPTAAARKPYAVMIFTAAGAPGATPVAQTMGTTGTGTNVPYAIANVPAGTYFVLGFVDVDGSGGTSSTPGDFAGWYGHNGDGNPPPAANAVVPASGSARFDFSLVLR